MSAATAVPLSEPSHPRWLAVGLIVLAFIKTWTGLTDLPALFFDYGHTETKLIVAQAITSVRLGITPLIAGFALYLAFRERLASSIAALALLILVTWLGQLPDIYLHGFDLSPTFGSMEMVLAFIIYPLLAAAALWLAWRDRSLPLAAGLVSVPTIVSGMLLVGFAISVAIWGF